MSRPLVLVPLVSQLLNKSTNTENSCGVTKIWIFVHIHWNCFMCWSLNTWCWAGHKKGHFARVKIKTIDWILGKIKHIQVAGSQHGYEFILAKTIRQMNCYQKQFLHFYTRATPSPAHDQYNNRDYRDPWCGVSWVVWWLQGCIIFRYLGQIAVIHHTIPCHWQPAFLCHNWAWQYCTLLNYHGIYARL